MPNGYVWWSNYLSADIVEMARNVVTTKQHQFTSTTVSTGEADYRNSRVLFNYDFPELSTIFLDRLRAMFHFVQAELGEHRMTDEPNDWELQMTSHNDGDYFKYHNDSGSPDCLTRKLTFVWYFDVVEQRRFTGGELMLHLPSGVETIQPNHNSIIFFPSGFNHEVLPVCNPSGDVMYGRHTLNGWVHHR